MIKKKTMLDFILDNQFELDSYLNYLINNNSYNE